MVDSGQSFLCPLLITRPCGPQNLFPFLPNDWNGCFLLGSWVENFQGHGLYTVPMVVVTSQDAHSQTPSSSRLVL